MNFNIDKQEFDSLSDLISLNKIRLSDNRLNDLDKRKAFIVDIQTLFINDCLVSSGVSSDDVCDKISSILEGSSKDVIELRLLKFSEAFATAVLLGYFQSFNSDRKVEGEIPSFGYKELDKNLRITFESYYDDFKSDTAISLISDGLLCNVRDIDSKTYFTQELYKEDLKFLCNVLTADINDGYNTKMLKAIEDDDSIGTILDKYIKNLEALYTYVLEDNFGVNPYTGVFDGNNGFIEISDSNHAVEISRGRMILRKLGSRLNSFTSSGLKVSNSRQFDYSEIYSSEKVVYYPYKMLEYVGGRESTLNLERNIYKPSAYSVSWESYSSNYVFKNLRAILIRGVYKAIEKISLSNKSISGDFTASSFTSKVVNYSEFIFNFCMDSSNVDKLGNYLSKLNDSMSCFYILSKYGYLAKRVTGLNLRLTNGTNFDFFSSTVQTTETLYKNLISDNDNEVFSSPFDLSSNRATVTNESLATTILEFQYDANPLLSKSEPLFGYIIQKDNQKKGIASNWGRILIGQSLSGKELYASKSSDIKMQNYFSHNIYAGSRSGKGVMTMNILVSAIASGKPIFYLDRKPDMASMLYQYSRGKQFVVNGGLINAKDDVFGKFDETTGEALHYWRHVSKPYLEANPDILNLFGVNTPTYAGVLGDYIYFRAAIFCLGLCVLRANAEGKNDSVFNKLNGKDGIVIVLDELTGYQSGISKLLSNINSLFVSKAKEMGSTDKIIEKRDEIDGKIRVAQAKLQEAKNESGRLKAEEEIRLLNNKKSALVDKQALYAATFFSKITVDYKILESQKVAGFKQGEFKYSDIFILGQILSANYYATSLQSKSKGALSSVFFPLLSSGDDYYASYKDADILRSFIEELGEEDWFLGRNPDYSYGEKNEEHKDIQRILDDECNWDYVGKHTCNEIRGVDSATFSHVFFKPYLVLNTCDEANPPLSGLNTTETDENGNVKSYTYVAQCADRVNTLAGGINLWEDVRVKHLTKEARKTYSAENKNYDCLNEGIGFKGLVRETLKTTPSGKAKANMNMDDYIADSLSKSGDIANFVAKKMGYNCWQELIFDFSVEGIFSFQDMIDAVLDPKNYTLERRLPIHSALGLSLNSSSLESELSANNGVKETEFYEFDGGYEEESSLEGLTSSSGEAPMREEFDNSEQEIKSQSNMSALERLRSESNEQRSETNEQKSDKLSDSQLFGIIDALLPFLQGFDLLEVNEQKEVKDGLFNFMRERGL